MSYDRSSGQRLWEYDVTGDGAAQSFHGEMARVGDGLYIAADPADGYVYHFDAETGAVRWQWHSEAGVSSDLFVVDSILVAVSEDNKLIALDAEAGTELWSTEAIEADRGPIPVGSTPVFVQGDLIFGRIDGRISRHHLATGKERWRAWVDAAVTTDLLWVDGQVVLGTEAGEILRLDVADGSIQARVQLDTMPSYRWLVAGDLLVGLTGFEGEGRQLIALDRKSLSPRWDLFAPEGGRWTIAQPALEWDVVLVGTAEPALYGVDVDTGVPLWRAETDHPPRTVSVDGDQIFIGTFDGTINAYQRESLLVPHD